MKIKSLLGTLALSLGLLASPAAAEKFVVGFQPLDRRMGGHGLYGFREEKFAAGDPAFEHFGDLGVE